MIDSYGTTKNVTKESKNCAIIPSQRKQTDILRTLLRKAQVGHAVGQKHAFNPPWLVLVMRRLEHQKALEDEDGFSKRRLKPRKHHISFPSISFQLKFIYRMFQNTVSDLTP
jgi:hypothetical protein